MRAATSSSRGRSRRLPCLAVGEGPLVPLLARLAVGLGVLLAGIPPQDAMALRFEIPPGQGIVGEIRMHAIEPEETLLDVARRYDVGYEALKAANPGVDPWLPKPGTQVRVPTRFILPDTPREGIVINRAEMRLYRYRKLGPDRLVVETYPIGIGRVGRETPLGRTRVVAKSVKPTWYPPKSIREEKLAEGIVLPPVVPPGPENPLGEFALRLGFPSYLIHGTNRPYSIGMRVSAGCVRLYPEDIEQLFRDVSPGTPVTIVHDPVKVAWDRGALYIESHALPEGDDPPVAPSVTQAVRAIVRRTPSERMQAVRWERVQRVVGSASGVPEPVAWWRGSGRREAMAALPPRGDTSRLVRGESAPPGTRGEQVAVRDPSGRRVRP